MRLLFVGALGLLFSLPLFPSLAVAQAQGFPAATAAPAPAPVDNSWMQYNDPYVTDQNDISTPHRSTDEIITWTISGLTDSMTFTPENFSAHLAEVKKYFTQPGWYEYATYMKESKMVDMVRDQKYSVTTVLNGDAAVINSAASGGSFHWLISAPLIVSFSYPDAEGNPAPVPGGTFRALIQVGRMSEGGGEDGIAIESWKVEAAKR